MKPILKDISFGVCTTGNIKALLMCLSSVLNGTRLPKAITLRCEGDMPAFSEFYIEQLSALARHYGVEFSISVGQSKGVRGARDWLLTHCPTQFLWMGDDDVVYAPECLENFDRAITEVTTKYFREDGKLGYIVGSKPDITNRRGYGDFSTTEYPTAGLKNYSSFNQFYTGEFAVVRANTLDTGNVVLNTTAILGQGLRFQAFDESFNAGGEDTLMGMRCNAASLYGFFCPTAASVHMEKPNPVFNEFAARGELILRSAEQLGIHPSMMVEFMPFLKKP